MALALNWSQVHYFIGVWCSKVLSRWHWNQIGCLTSIFKNIIDFESFMRCPLFNIFLVLLKYDFLLFLLLFNHLLIHAMNFRKIDHSFAIGEGRNAPLSSFIIPAGVVDDMF
jgi:hypothetical protein